jgi:ubiquinone/menaquinone biosynthesis C-methylase UbiE
MTWVFSVNDHFLHIGTTPADHLKNVPLKSGMSVVDYACGPGRYTIPVAGIVGPQGTVYAVDIQPLAIETVKRIASNKSLANIKAVLVDSFNTGLQCSSADMILLIHAIQGIKEHRALFREIHRLLKREGFFFMDAGHVEVTKVRRMVEDSGLFTLIKLDGKDMLLTKK